MCQLSINVRPDRSVLTNDACHWLIGRKSQLDRAENDVVLAMNKTAKVLISAYACSPNWGSEPGMGWNWVNQISEHFEAWVLTDEIYAKQCRDYLTANKIDKPNLHVVGISRPGGHKNKIWGYFWLHYLTQNLWQRKAYKVAKELHAREHFDLFHRLNMIGYREPGYLWSLDPDVCYVWGPIGGYAQMPKAFISFLGGKDRIVYSLRNCINAVQMRIGSRVRQAMRRSNLLLAATRADQTAILRFHNRDAMLMNETGTVDSLCELDRGKFDDLERPLELVWVGIFLGRKALSLGLHALARAYQQNPRINVRLHVVGYGPCEKVWKKLAQDLKIASLCVWHGMLPHDQALRQMQQSDVMLFTSLQEGTPHVVTEAISHGIPVICHDACGFGDVITDRCGIKVPMTDPETSIRGFAEAIVSLHHDRQQLRRLSEGALVRARDLIWERKGDEMVKLYRGVMDVMSNGARA